MAPALLWAVGAWFLLVLASPIMDRTLSPLVAYLGPVAIGFVGAFLGRGAAGLLGILVGIVVGNIAVIVVGLVPAPTEGELPERIPYTILFTGLAAVGYLVGGRLRARRARRSR